MTTLDYLLRSIAPETRQTIDRRAANSGNTDLSILQTTFSCRALKLVKL